MRHEISTRRFYALVTELYRGLRRPGFAPSGCHGISAAIQRNNMHSSPLPLFSQVRILQGLDRAPFVRLRIRQGNATARMRVCSSQLRVESSGTRQGIGYAGCRRRRWIGPLGKTRGTRAAKRLERWWGCPKTCRSVAYYHLVSNRIYSIPVSILLKSFEQLIRTTDSFEHAGDKSRNFSRYFECSNIQNAALAETKSRFLGRPQHSPEPQSAFEGDLVMTPERTCCAGVRTLVRGRGRGRRRAWRRCRWRYGLPG